MKKVFYPIFVREADLSRTVLSGANLYESDLEGADLSLTNLTGANLRYARLQGSDLRGANLTNINYDNKTRYYKKSLLDICIKQNK